MADSKKCTTKNQQQGRQSNKKKKSYIRQKAYGAAKEGNRLSNCCLSVYRLQRGAIAKAFCHPGGPINELLTRHDIPLLC